MDHFIYRRITKQQLVFELTRDEITERYARRLMAFVEHPGCLWRVVETTARLEGVFGMKAGESWREIICDVILRDEDTGELGYRSIPEHLSPYLYSCPLHFFDMVPERSPRWRKVVRDCHEEHQQREQKNAQQRISKEACFAA